MPKLYSKRVLASMFFIFKPNSPMYNTPLSIFNFKKCEILNLYVCSTYYFSKTPDFAPTKSDTNPNHFRDLVN